MYNLVYDLFDTTCTSGIQQVGLWQTAISGSWTGTASTNLPGYTYIDLNLNLPNKTYFTGIQITSTASGNFKLKLARTRNLSQWDVYDVITVTHTGGTGNYIFQPFWIPDDSRSYYIGFYSVTYIASVLGTDLVSPAKGCYTSSSDITGRFTNFTFNSRLNLCMKSYVSTISPISIVDSSSFPITLASGAYIGVELQSQSEFKCTEISVDTYSGSALMKVDYAKFAGDIYSSNGVYNNNTGYCTPKMIYYDEPAGYAARASTEVVGYYSYEAFSQVNDTEAQCWMSANTTAISGTAPQSLVFTFSGTGKAVNRYQLLSRNHSSASYRGFPNTWTLQASNDSRVTAGSDLYWITLDSRSSISDPGQNTWSSIFNFDNAQSYRYYRFRITARNSQSTGYYYVCIGDIKLIEADQVFSYPSFNWYPGNWIVSSGTHTTISYNNQPMDQIRLFFGNTSSSSITISGINVWSYGNETIGISAPTTTLRYNFTTLDPTLVDIKNNFHGRVFPRVSIRYTGNYEIDRNVYISPDYATAASGDDVAWYGLSSQGVVIPEEYPWQLGTLSGTTVYQRQLQLTASAVSGTWTSPVFPTDSNFGLYLYPRGSNYPQLEIRASNTRPAEAVFSIVTTENTSEYLMYQHKRILMDSNGYVIGKSECDSDVTTGNKIWRMADYTFAGQPLNYHGCVNTRGTAAFLAPGYTSCSDVDPMQETLDGSKWYNLCICKLDDTSMWTTGTTISGFEWGKTKNVLFTKTFPVGDSDSFFVASISTSTPQEEDQNIRTCVNMGYYRSGQTLMSFPIVTLYDYQLVAGDYFDIAQDYANNGWWVYLGGSIGKVYKTDVGSFNTVHAFGMGALYSKDPASQDMYFGYLYELDFDADYKHIVGIPDTEFSGFWAFSASGISLIKEEYTYDVPSFDNVRSITESTIVSGTFVELHQGECDSYGNLWVFDISQERLFRVNLKRALDLNDPNPIDSDIYVSGIAGVFPHPTNELAYVFCSNSLMNPDGDTVRMVSAGQDPYADSQFVCAVPGFSSADFKRCVDFTGTTYDNYYRVRSTDLTWSTDGGGWYSSTNMNMIPRGNYVQFRLTFSRTDITRATPSMDRVRIPSAVKLNPMDYREIRQIAIKTEFNKAKTFGVFNTKLLVWWFDEEFIYS